MKKANIVNPVSKLAREYEEAERGLHGQVTGSHGGVSAGVLAPKRLAVASEELVKEMR